MSGAEHGEHAVLVEADVEGELRARKDLVAVGAVERAAKEMEPHYVVTYLTELAAAFNSWYAAERIIVDGVVNGYTLELVKAVEKTLAKGLQVLGIPAPEKM